LNTRTTTFADETSTGESRGAEYRGIGRATIAARCEADDHFEWLSRLACDFLPKGEEAKSKVLLPLMESNPRLRDTVLNNLQNSTIVIVDFYEHTRSLIEAAYSAVRLPMPSSGDPLAPLRSQESLRPLAESIIHHARETAILCSSIPRIEGLLQTAAQISYVPLGTGPELFDRRALREMSDKQVKELVGRFSVALADAFRPDVREKAMEQFHDLLRIYSPGHIAVVSIQHAMEPDRIYDQGSDPVFDMLLKAHLDIEKRLEGARNEYILEASRPGTLSQEDSRGFLGLQAADIAAAIARREFERSPRRLHDGAHAVPQLFSRVLFNDQWL
jgi:hypothetical protein